MTITLEELKRRFRYEPETGLLFHAREQVESGFDIPCGSKNGDGYITLRIERTTYRVHRLAWLYVYGEFPKGFIDHINHDRSDNRIENLRTASNGQNKWNCVAQKNNSTGAKGVYFDKPRGAFVARINCARKVKFLGRFDSADEAAHAYNKAAIHYHGEFACLNPIGVDK